MITNTGRNLCKKVVRITLTNDTTSETLFIFDGFDFFRGVHVTRFFTGWPERRAVPIDWLVLRRKRVMHWPSPALLWAEPAGVAGQ